MQRLLAITAAAMVCAAPGLAQAATIYAPGNAICSGEFSTETSGDVSLFCRGDLALTGGEIVSEAKLLILASGSLSLGDIRLVGSEITLATLFSAINIGEKVIFDTTSGEQPQVTLVNVLGSYTPPLVPADTIYPGYGSVSSTLTFYTPPMNAVPEPTTWALMLAGVAMLGALRRR